MKTSNQLVAHTLCIALAWIALPSPVRAAADGIGRLIAVSTLKADKANEEALLGADKQKQLIEEKKKVRGAQAALDQLGQQGDEQVAHAGLIVKDVAAVAALESTAGADGLDDAEREQLAALVATAQQRVDGATADAATAIANAKKQLEEANDADAKKLLALRMKSLRATMKAHRQTTAALRAVAKKLSKSAG